MKNPTLVTAATATVNAIINTVSRPARRPRIQLRVARRQAFIFLCAPLTAKLLVYADFKPNGVP